MNLGTTDTLLSEELQSSAHPSPADLEAFLPHACRQLVPDIVLRVHTATQEEYVSKFEKVKKTKHKSVSALHTSHTAAHEEDELALGGEDPDPGDLVHLTLVRDACGDVVELVLDRSPVPPRLLRVLALALPFHPALGRLALRRSPLAGAALHEVARLLLATHLTELCLDDSPVRCRNHRLLLEAPRLRALSLARCRLDDEDARDLAAGLEHPRPAAATLALLGLASNRVGDPGAAALGRALRSNRALLHLDLADNDVTSAGAAALLASLAEFRLTGAELAGARRRRLEYARRRAAVHAAVLRDLTAAGAGAGAGVGAGVGADEARGRRRTGLRARPSQAAAAPADPAARAHVRTLELVGPFVDPFSRAETVSRDGRVYSTGNRTLCWLNLSYNALEYPTLGLLAAVLEAQREAARPGGGGLVRVVVEGNPVPGVCAELAAVEALLDRALDLATRNTKFTRKLESRKSKASRTIAV